MTFSPGTQVHTTQQPAHQLCDLGRCIEQDVTETSVQTRDFLSPYQSSKQTHKRWAKKKSRPHPSPWFNNGSSALPLPVRFLNCPTPAFTMGSSTGLAPKRKHAQLSDNGQPLTLNTAKFSFELAAGRLDDGSSSPRTKVAHKFRGLVLEGGGGGGGGGVDSDATAQGDDTGMRKRAKVPTPSPDRGSGCNTEPVGTSEGPKGERAVMHPHVALDPAIVLTGRAGTAAHRPPESKSRRRRAGTPPTSKASSRQRDRDDDVEIVDPIRAALTWQDDEITVYDPDDEDDDGTGINGVGFEPTPAIAHARSLKRKQQMAEYKKREDGEARAKRNQRRRGNPACPTPESKKPSSLRRVHFAEAESIPVVTT